MTLASEAARRRIMSEAQALLERIGAAGASAAYLSDPEAAQLVRELERQAIAPTPNVVMETESGVTFTWE